MTKLILPVLVSLLVLGCSKAESKEAKLNRICDKIHKEETAACAGAKKCLEEADSKLTACKQLSKTVGNSEKGGGKSMADQVSDVQKKCEGGDQSECATWGDPAFDLGFGASHLLLKCRWNPSRADGFLACYDALAAAHLALVTWESRDALEGRAARWAAACLLARVDGMSPVEYLDDDGRRRTRHVARELLGRAGGVRSLTEVRAAWSASLA